MTIKSEDLITADIMMTDLESDMQKVFSKIGKTDTSVHVDRILSFIANEGQVPYQKVYQYVHDVFPSARDFEDVIAGCCRSGKLNLIHVKGVPILRYQGVSDA